MRNYQILLPLGLLLIALGVPSNAQGAGPSSTAPPAAEPSAGEGLVKTVHYDVGKAFALNCTLAPSAGLAYEWRKNGSLVVLETPGAALQLTDGGAVLRPVGRSTEEHYGSYSCSLGAQLQAFELRGNAHVKLSPNTNVVEGQKLKLSCKVIGKPYPAVSWQFRNASGTENATDVELAFGDRVQLQPNDQGIAGATLVLPAAARGDAGELTCFAGGSNSTSTLRVKDMYAALWPFLGIVCEVALLCAAILLYEKRRTKPELDDSDTDNHEQ